jgi:hypothetical protein
MKLPDRLSVVAWPIAFASVLVIWVHFANIEAAMFLQVPKSLLIFAAFAFAVGDAVSNLDASWSRLLLRIISWLSGVFVGALVTNALGLEIWFTATALGAIVAGFVAIGMESGLRTRRPAAAVARASIVALGLGLATLAAIMLWYLLFAILALLPGSGTIAALLAGAFGGEVVRAAEAGAERMGWRPVVEV